MTPSTSFLTAITPTTASRRRLTAFAAGLATFAVASSLAVAQAPSPDPLIARVNGVEIHQSDLALAEEDLGRDIPATGDAAKRDYLVNYLTDMILISKEAEAKKIPDTAEFKQRTCAHPQQDPDGRGTGGQAKTAVTEPALHKIYDDAVKNAGAQQEVHARHILFRVNDPNDQAASKAAEDKVKAVIVRLKKGEDFATVAKALTEDPSGKQDGGDLGLFHPGPDGAGVLRGRVQTRKRPNLRSGENPVRLACA